MGDESIHQPGHAAAPDNPPLVEVRLFGSFARGEAHEDSDVDVLVLVQGLTDLEIGLAAGDVAPVIAKTGLPLAPLPMASEKLAEMRRRAKSPLLRALPYCHSLVVDDWRRTPRASCSSGFARYALCGKLESDGSFDRGSRCNLAGPCGL